MKAKKSFGQHFLNSEDVASRIASSFSQKDALTALLEVGPGKGVLTKYLVKMPVEFLAVEADADMVGYLAHYLPETEGKIIQADFLKWPLDDLFDRKPFGLIGNFPYNISSQILIKMLQHRDQIPEMVGMFQKELAERVIAGPGSKTYGVISVLVQAYYRCEYLFTVQPGSFSPPPKVKSGVNAVAQGQPAYVTLTAGDHGSLFSPTASPAATVELQTQAIKFAASANQPGGPFVVITNPAIVEQ